MCRQILEVLAAVYKMDKSELAETIYRTSCSLFKWKP
jgi:Tat protein secretion system quality control protein TatD with DNase activity